MLQGYRLEDAVVEDRVLIAGSLPPSIPTAGYI
jgi:hypothetical protein